MNTIALIGNPNVGKTTLFNLLTGSNQYVGNWAGVTVEKKEGFIDKNTKLVDLPGIYAMDTYSNEEKVSKNFLINQKPDLIINIVDASNLERNLYLTMQLKQFNIPIILVLNMIDVALEKGINIDTEKLAQKLNIKVIGISASKKTGIDNLKELLNSLFLRGYIDNDYPYQLLGKEFEYIDTSNEDKIYKYIEAILNECIIVDKKGVSKLDFIDRIVLNKFLSYPVFLMILFTIFKFTFSWIGGPLTNIMDIAIQDYIIPFIGNILKGSSPWFKSLIIDGILGGIGSVIVFLPIILTLFFFISFLEDSGYMARAAFIMDKIMRHMGLSGKAFIPLVIGFGCSVPGIMSTRTLESDKDRKLTALLVPLMSCNARLPVYTLFASVFFEGRETIIVFSLYLLGIFLSFIIGLLFKNTIFRKDEEPFIIELPEYKLPNLKDILSHTWHKGESFLKKMGTVIFSASVIVWFLSNFNQSGITDINTSFLSYIGKALSPVFLPLGFGSWQNSVSLLTGIVAKEVVVGTMGVLYGGNLKLALLDHFTPITSLSFMVFVLLYTPCISVIATIKKEYGIKMMQLSLTYQLLLAWIASFIVYNIGIYFFV